jgi:ATP-dependent helicase HrpA
LNHYPRYLKAIEERWEQLQQNPLKDQQRMAEIKPWWDRYLGALERGDLYDEHLDAYRWLLEEYRVSLFAQRLGTDGKVSEKRLKQSWKNTGLTQ